MEIPIEARDDFETTHVQGCMDNGAIATVRVAPQSSQGGNLAFDVTPNRLITGLITERGVCPETSAGLAALFPEMAQAGRKRIQREVAEDNSFPSEPGKRRRPELSLSAEKRHEDTP